MSYRPSDERIKIGDTWHCSTGDKVHAFFLQFQKEGKEDAGEEVGGIGHAISTDLLNWKQLPLALPKGVTGSYDDLEHWTGCTIYHNDMFYLFYTSRSSVKEMFSNSVATSVDGIHFDKHPENPLFSPDERYYYGVNNLPVLRFHGNHEETLTYDFRDLCVIWDEAKKIWRGYFVARIVENECTKTAAIGMATSHDLIHWEQHPPCFVPQKYHVMETPEVFEINGKWYMLCLSGNIYGQRHCTKDPIPYNRITFYAVADNPEGPFYEPENNLLIANMNESAACAKTVLHNSERYLFYTEVHSSDGDISERYHYMSTPKRVCTDENGRLMLNWYNTIEKYYTNEKFAFDESTVIKNDGCWGSHGKWTISDTHIDGFCETDWSVQPFDNTVDDFVFETTFHNYDAKSVGIFFGLGDSIFDGGLSVVLDYLHNEVLITTARNFQVLDARTFDFKKNTYNLRVFTYNKTIEVYLDDELILHHLTNRSAGRVGLMVESGKASFTNAKMHSLTKFTC